MKVCLKSLWKVPIFCIAAGWLSYYITVYIGRFFFVVTSIAEDGSPVIYSDPLRTVLFDFVLFFVILILGRLWAFRSMTKMEIAASAIISVVLYLAILGIQLQIKDLPLTLNMALVKAQNWKTLLSSLIFRLTNHVTLSSVLSSFAPLLFLCFHKKDHT